MKAKDFARDVGWDKVRKIIEKASFGSHYRVDTKEIICCHNEQHFYFQDLIKQGVVFIKIDALELLVESYELVKEHGSIERAKIYAESKYTAPEVKERLKQAVEDVESTL